MAFNLPRRFMNLTLVTGVGAVGLAGLAYALRDTLPPPLGPILWHAAAVGGAVSLASTERLAAKSTAMFGKAEDGHMPWLRWLLFWPFHAAVQTVMLGYRLVASEPLVSRVADGWYLGGCPTRTSDLPPGPSPALLDVSCELPRRVAGGAYKMLPSWETHGLEPQQIEEGVQWALQQRAAGRPVLTYCTHGHGRSAVMACALLIAYGKAGSIDEAGQKVVHARPGAKPNSRQWEALAKWYEQFAEKHRGSGGSGSKFVEE